MSTANYVDTARDLPVSSATITQNSINMGTATAVSPSISLKNDTLISAGVTGTRANPYVIQKSKE